MPIGYGRLKIGSVVVSNTLYNQLKDTDSENQPPIFAGVQIRFT